jgi:hypothetical protein
VKVGIAVYCEMCNRQKAPIGRSAPMGCELCDDDCEGYRDDPKPGSLWPGETEEDFGYPVGPNATEEKP